MQTLAPKLFQNAFIAAAAAFPLFGAFAEAYGQERPGQDQPAAAPQAESAELAAEQPSEANTDPPVKKAATWIRVRADYNADGRFDTTGQMHIDDFRQALQQSRQRLAAGNGREVQGSQRQDRSAYDDSNTASNTANDRLMSQGKRTTLRGTIAEIQPVELAGCEEPYAIARLQTANKRIGKVLLGPQSAIEKLQLKEGGTIQVVGRLARINDRPVLAADRVVTPTQAVDVTYQRQPPLKRVRGELRNVRSTEFSGVDQPHTVAEIKLRNGRIEHIDLGVAERLSDLKIDDGTLIAALVRPDSVNGQQVLVADEIVVGDRLVVLAAPE